MLMFSKTKKFLVNTKVLSIDSTNNNCRKKMKKIKFNLSQIFTLNHFPVLYTKDSINIGLAWFGFFV